LEFVVTLSRLQAHDERLANSGDLPELFNRAIERACCTDGSMQTQRSQSKHVRERCGGVRGSPGRVMISLRLRVAPTVAAARQ